jgi:hypothetical protein
MPETASPAIVTERLAGGELPVTNRSGRRKPSISEHVYGLSRYDRIGLAIAELFAVAGIFGLVIGAHDLALRDEAPGIRVVGALLLASGVLLAVASFLLSRVVYRKAPMTVATGRVALSSCLALAVGASFFAIAELESFNKSAIVLVLAILTALAGVASLVFLRIVTKVTIGKVGPTIIALVGTAFAVFQFWYEQQYLPTREPPALEATAKLEPTGTVADGLRAYRVTVTLKNVGSTKVLALAGAYSVGGSKLVPLDATGTPKDVLAPFRSTAIDPYAGRFSRHSREEPSAVIQALKLFAENRYFEPGEELTREYAVFVPRCNYSLLRLRVHVVVAKGTLLRMRNQASLGPGFFSDPGRLGVYGQWHIEDNSWVHDILDGKEESILVNYVSRQKRFDPGFFNVTAWLVSGTAARSPKEVASFTRRARERLGLADTLNDFELPVTQANGGSGAGSCSSDQAQAGSSTKQ